MWLDIVILFPLLVMYLDKLLTDNLPLNKYININTICSTKLKNLVNAYFIAGTNPFVVVSSNVNPILNDTEPFSSTFVKFKFTSFISSFLNTCIVISSSFTVDNSNNSLSTLFIL